MKNNLNRAEKIALLSGIRNGTRSLTELLSTEYPVWWNEALDTFVNKATGKTLNAAEYEKMKKGLQRNHEIILVKRGNRLTEDAQQSVLTT